jgi:hypothetical protein
MWQNLTQAVQELKQTYAAAFDPYRPELHYMRGPGPAWQAKRATTVTLVPIPVVVPAQAKLATVRA